MNGTKLREPIKKTSLSGEEVCSIIEKCRQSGVSEFRLGELHLHFGPRVELREVPPQAPEKSASYPVNHETQSREALEVSEMQEREERLAMLLIEDPVEFERQLVNGDLIEDDGSEQSAEEAHDI